MRALLVIVVAACTHTATPDTFVRLEQTECLGRCPVYTLTLYADGAVEYEGKRFVPTGKRWRTARPQEIARLMELAEHTPDWTCDPARIVTDQPESIITVSRHHQTRRIVHDHGDPCAPASLERLEGDLDLEGGTAHFLSGNPE
ncbi:MAG TPA: DUF6438 domain-containing protein [Kofleriaceae bacterium]|nr:DUF6438 domain-containing protein [Kofleriaceae bacterium]